MALAGCAPAERPGIDQRPTQPQATPEQPAAEPDPASPYADGNYQASATYRAPSGNDEPVSVALTLQGGVITDITVTPGAHHPTSIQYQTKFAGGIAQVAVGRAIDSLQVTRVAGSSFTSGGFNKAIEQIKSDALGG